MKKPQWEFVSSEAEAQDTGRSDPDETALRTAALELGQRLGDIGRFRRPDDPDPAIALFGRIDAFAETVGPSADLGLDGCGSALVATRTFGDEDGEATSDERPETRPGHQIDIGSPQPEDQQQPARPAVAESVSRRSSVDEFVDRLRRHRTSVLVAATFAFIAVILIGGMASDSARSLLAGDSSNATTPPIETAIEAGDVAAPILAAEPTATPDTLVVRRQAVSERDPAGPDRSSGEVDASDAAENAADAEPSPQASTGEAVGSGSDSSPLDVVVGTPATASTRPSSTDGPAPSTTIGPVTNRPTTTPERPTSTASSTTARRSSTTTSPPTSTPATTSAPAPTSTAAPTSTSTTVVASTIPPTTNQPPPDTVIPIGTSLIGADVEPGQYLSRPITTACEVLHLDINGLPLAAGTFLPGDRVHLVLIWSNWVWLGSTCPDRYDRL